MGFDFEWNRLPPEAAVVRDDFERWLYFGGRPPRAVDEHPTGPYELHLNISGMAECREIMQRFGMVYEVESRPFPRWPTYDPLLYGRTYDEGINEWTRLNRAQVDRLVALELEAMCQHDPTRPGIPLFKFCSNGPWVVTVHEVRTALEIYDDADLDARAQAEQEQLWTDWITYVRGTVDHDGFKVG